MWFLNLLCSWRVLLIVGGDAEHIPASPGAPLYTALCSNDCTVPQGGLRPSVSMSRRSTDEQSLDDMAPARKNITTLEGKHFSPSSPLWMEAQHRQVLGTLLKFGLGALLQTISRDLFKAVQCTLLLKA